LDAATAWAEWRNATGGAVDPATERRRLWRIGVDGLRVVDLREESVREALGVAVDELVGDRTRCQALAREAARLGAEGLVVPSAAAQGAWNLVVLPGGLRRLRPLDSTVRRPAPPRA
jgi:RES domain-containing protein